LEGDVKRLLLAMMIQFAALATVDLILQFAGSMLKFT
jgi:hypothetical protein